MIKKKIIPKFNFLNPKKVETQSKLERIVEILRNINPIQLRQPFNEYFEIIPPQLFLNDVIYNNETTQLYTVLENEDGWYTDGTYESTFITIDMKKFIW
jgi:hypothetical protein